jgi:Cu(I)/Ag(I) efflux system membrane protein CusA/SilA
MLWGNGAGASVMRRIAAPMIGGMISSTVLTLLVIPAIYSLWKERSLLLQPAATAVDGPIDPATSPNT